MSDTVHAIAEDASVDLTREAPQKLAQRPYGAVGRQLEEATGLPLVHGARTIFRRCVGTVMGVAVVVVLTATNSRAQEFGYFGENGPVFWDLLSHDWTTCGTGEIQSPINFGWKTLLTRQSPRLPVKYGHSTGEIFNNGHTIEVEVSGGNVLELRDVEYELEQFHFHTPSEHRLNRHGFDMEMHLVHTSAAGDNAVIGVFLNRGGTSGPLSVVFENLPDVDAPLNTKTPLPPFDLRTFLPWWKAHYRYLGSLTTPPCTEGVRWLVLKHALTVSDEDMAQFTRRIPFNARLVQRSSH